MTKAVFSAVVIAAIIAAGLAGLHFATADRIAAHAKARTEAQMRALFPLAVTFSKQPLPELSAPLTSHGHWLALDSQEQSLGRLIAVTTPRGYSGDIDLLVGIKTNGKLAGARVTAHRETPGLGDAIDAKRSNWIKQFTGLSLEQPRGNGWRLTKHGGEIDAITSATISASAVINAIRQTLEMVDSSSE